MIRRFRSGLLIGIFLFSVGAAGVAIRPAYAATVTVNSLAGTAFGICNAALCTLPDAIGFAASGDTINFSVTGTIFLNSSLPPITKSLTIDGTGQSITIDGANNSGIGSIFIVNTAGIMLNLSNLTIQHGSAGSATAFAGGAMYIGAAATVNITNCTFANNQALTTSLGGGAIEVFNSGATLNINNCTFSGNAASNTNSGGQASGGAIDGEAGGTINIANSLFTGNSAHATAFAGGGAIFSYNGGGKGGTVRIANSTFFNNSTDANGAGGAINTNPGNSLLDIVNSTFLNNMAGGSPNGLINWDGVFILQNSIVKNGACTIGKATGANNLVDDASCGTTLGFVTTLDTALANNGGPTQTIKLKANSNAIDAVPAGQCIYPSGFPNLTMFNGGAGNAVNVDQRGVARAQGPACDIGAYEVQPGAATTLTVSGYPSPVTAGTSNAFQVSARDTNGYIAYSYTGTVHFSSSDGNPATVLPADYTFVGGDFGIHQFSATLATAGNQSIKAKDTVNAGIIGAQNNIQVNAASASQLAFTQQPTNAAAGAAIAPPVTVRIQDQYGNVVSSSANVTVDIGANPGSATLSGTLTQAAAGGVATFNDLSLNRPGTGYTLTAASSGLSGATSNPFNVTFSAAKKLAFIQQPSNAATNAAITPPITVAVEDNPGNVITTDNSTQVTLAIQTNPSAGTLSGTTTVTAAGGVATFNNLSIDKAGNGYILVASSTPALTTPASNPFNIIPSASIDTIGVFRSGAFLLRLHNSTGFADISVTFNPAGKPYPVVGDWTGAGYDTVGIYDQNTGTFYLCSANDSATCAAPFHVQTFTLGNPNDIPLSGRWTNGAATFGAGVFRPSNGLIYLKNGLTTGFADDTMVLGIPGDVGLAGDWNGDGVSSPGVYRASTQRFYLTDQVCNCTPTANYTLQYGVAGDYPVAGDWIGQGHAGIGLFRQSNGFTYLRNTLTTGVADITFVYGIAGDVPVAGHWQLVYPPLPRPGTVLVPPGGIIAPTPAQPPNGLGD